MKGKVGTPMQLTYLFPKVNKKTYKFARYLKLSVKAQRRLDAIEIYQKSENIKVKEIADAYKIHPSTFYRWLKRYNPKRIESLEDRSRSPKNPRKPTARIPEVEIKVCAIRRKYPALGKEKIKVILERDYGIKVSASTVGRILTRYKSVLPSLKEGRKRKIIRNKRKSKKIRLKDVKDKLKGLVGELFQVDTLEMWFEKIKVYVFVGIDKVSRLSYMKAYRSKSSSNGKDFLRSLKEVSGDRLKYVQVDNGSEFRGEFEKEAGRLGIVKITNYVRSPKMNCYVEKVIDTVQLEWGYKLEDLEEIEEVNKELNKFLIYYNFYRPHQSLLYKTPIDFFNQNLYNTTNNNLLHMYRTQSFA